MAMASVLVYVYKHLKAASGEEKYSTENLCTANAFCLAHEYS